MASSSTPPQPTGRQIVADLDAIGEHAVARMVQFGLTSIAKDVDAELAALWEVSGSVHGVDEPGTLRDRIRRLIDPAAK